MQPNDLEQLLQRADRAADISLASPGELGNRARHRVRRQKQVRSAAAASVGIALILLVVNFVREDFPADNVQPQIATNVVAPPKAIADLEGKIEALRAEADRLESIVLANRQASRERIRTASLHSSRATTNRSRPMPIPVKLLIEQEAEITARVMVEQATLWLTQANRRDEAIRSFERTIALFPSTAAAKTARIRLTEIKNKSGATI